jgi:hypothetical protein
MTCVTYGPGELINAKRDANSAAHGLAREAVKHVIDKVRVKEISNCIYDILIREQFARV